MSLVGDVRFALRSLVKNRGFASAALVTVAIGVGATTAVFTVVNAAILTPLPFPEADRLIAIHAIDRGSPHERHEVAYPDFRQWQRALRSVKGMAAHGGAFFVLASGDTTERVQAARVSGNYFDVLGIRALHGRTLEDADDGVGAAPVIVLGESLWTRAFNRDPAALGRTVRLYAPFDSTGTLATIVGVVPANFAGPPDSAGFQDRAQLWVTINRFAAQGELNNRAGTILSPVIARLQPGVSISQAQAELDAVAADLERQYPENRGRAAVVVSFANQYFGHVRPTLWIMFGAVTLVLALACANVASLLLARGDARQRELALRTALGARRSRLVWLLLAESLTVSILGGAVGVLLAAWLTDVLVALSPVSLPSFVRVAIDARVLAFTLGVSLINGLLCGLAPAVLGTRTDLVGRLKLGAGGSTGSPFLRRRLVTMQIALAMVLVIGAGLMIRTLDRLRAFDPGFRLDGLLAVAFSLPVDAVGNAAATGEALRGLLDRVRATPGIESASLTWDLPLIDIWLPARVRLLDRDMDPVPVRRHTISSDHFRTLGIPLIAGRDFTANDNRSAGQYAAIVSRRMAERYWPGRAALHQRLLYNNRTFEIVGVVGDVQHESLLAPATSAPDVYMPIEQMALTHRLMIVMRTSAEHGAVAGNIRASVARLGAGATLFKVQTGEMIFGAQIARQRFMGALLTVLALAALAVTVVGVYGVAAYNAGRRTREIGIRMALGATRGDLLRALLRVELSTILQGVALGFAAGVALTGTLSALLYGVSPTDRATLAAVTALTSVVALLGCYVPARRAARVDPVVALRVE